MKKVAKLVMIDNKDNYLLMYRPITPRLELTPICRVVR